MTAGHPRPLRIGMACFSTFGGSGVVAAELALALGQRGHQVFLLSDRPPVRLPPASPHVVFRAVPLLDYPLAAQSSYALALAARMIELVHAEQLDVLHAHYAVPHAVSAYLAKQALGARAPRLLTTLHGTDVTVLGDDPAFRDLVRLVVEASDGVTVPSSYLAEAATTNLGLDRGLAIDVIPNFVDTGRFVPAVAPPGHTPRVVTHVSSFRPLKRVDDVVRVFAGIRGEVPARLDLVGDGPERARVEGLARALGLDGEVRFLGPRAELAELLQQSDVFLFPSQTESFGLAALEAMACGVPVVASDVGGIGEVVRHGEAGFLAPMGDVPAMIRYVRTLLTDDGLHARMARRARELAETRFATAPTVDAYEAVYRRLLAMPVRS